MNGPYDIEERALQRMEMMMRRAERLLRRAREDPNFRWMLYGCVMYAPAWMNLGNNQDGLDPEAIFPALEKKVAADVAGEDSNLAVRTLLGHIRRGSSDAPKAEDLAAFLFLLGFEPIEIIEGRLAAHPVKLPSVARRALSPKTEEGGEE